NLNKLITLINNLLHDMFAARIDTTYTLVEWTLFELIRPKNTMAKLKHELKTIAGPTSIITEGNLHKCHYLKAVVKETLRLHPPLPLLVPQESTEDVKILRQFELIPFGGGRRGCPGGAFAMGIVELVLANVVLDFEFELPGGASGEDLDMCEGDGLTIHRKFPLRVVVSCECLP
ncbi:hypothetical protein MIMGU_mgv1a021111mg, partial [Erythranthe guttata]